MAGVVHVKIEYDEDNELGDVSDEIHDERVRHGSAYYRYFKDIYDSVLVEHGNDDTTNLENPYYTKEFLDYALEFLLPYYGLWSAVVLIDFGLYRESNATAENWFKTVKVDVFKKTLRDNPARFVQKMETYLLGRLKNRKFTTLTARQRKRRVEKKNLDRAKEVWKDCKG